MGFHSLPKRNFRWFRTIALAIPKSLLKQVRAGMPHREEELVELFITDESTVWVKEIDFHLQRSVRLKLFPKSTITYFRQDVLNELLDLCESIVIFLKQKVKM